MGAGVKSPRKRMLGDVCKDGYLRRLALVRVVHGLDGESQWPMLPYVTSHFARWGVLGPGKTAREASLAA